jgi:zinc protease
MFASRRRRGLSQLAAPFYWARITLGLLLSSSLAWGAPARGADFAAAAGQVQTKTLANGLQIIVWPVHNIPNVVLYNWVRVGSRNESSGATGLAHFFEHMMFNGTTDHPKGDFERLLGEAGGSSNANTRKDVTVFQDWFPRSALQTVLMLESDRIAHLAFVPEVVENERKVVYSERRLRVEDSAPALLSEQLEAVALLAHPYRIPTIGWPSDIQSWTLADLENFYHTFYAPNNCTLVIVGDVEPAPLFALIERYFGPIPRGALPEPVRTREPEQLGERRLQLHRPAETGLVQVLYPALSAADPRQPALDLLQMVLTGGESSRLHRALVEERRLAIEVDSDWSEGLDPSLLGFYATLAEGATSAQFEQALEEELTRVVHDGVSDAELVRAKRQSAVAFWRGVTTLDGRAELLGEYALMHGDYRLLFSAPAALERVTAADVKSVAQQILNPLHRTVGELVPDRNGAQP